MVLNWDQTCSKNVVVLAPRSAPPLPTSHITEINKSCYRVIFSLTISVQTLEEAKRVLQRFDVVGLQEMYDITVAVTLDILEVDMLVSKMSLPNSLCCYRIMLIC